MTDDAVMSLRDIVPTLERWQKGIADEDVDLIASAFTETALFQGLGPEPVFGREGVRGYYGSQPDPLTVEYEVLRFVPIGEQAAVAYLKAVFHPRGRDPRPTYLTLVFHRVREAWLIEHYHVSLIA
ncbi:MAG: SnoaL-like domain-containing protein [Catenulispora sp.]|nr:SnoaL-like domain-containing protein [Catenulispora sp.]